jgi:alkaline phosphatase
LGPSVVGVDVAVAGGPGVRRAEVEDVRRDDDTGEGVLVAAQGPGAERMRGFLSNTDLFHIMMAAYGWR